MATLLATPFAVLFARVLALCLPYRERPLHELPLHFQIPLTQNPDWLIHWSSFPSDHAAVSFCVAAGLWIVSKRLGGWAMGYATLISLPRVYLGFHYPTDIIGGAFVGIGTAFLFRAAALRSVARWVLNFLDRRPAYLYTFLFVFTFEIAEMFSSLQSILLLGVGAFHRYPRWRWKEFAGVLILSGLLGLLTGLTWWWKYHSVGERPGRAVRHHA
jgi:undecaprenyl-diphosphatase